MAAHTGFRVDTIQFGQEIRDEMGVPTIATADMVQVALVLEGRTLGAGVFTPEGAVEFAGQLTTAASTLAESMIEDPAPPLSLRQRLFGGLL